MLFVANINPKLKKKSYELLAWLRSPPKYLYKHIGTSGGGFDFDMGGKASRATLNFEEHGGVKLTEFDAYLPTMLNSSSRLHQEYTIT